MLIDSHYKQLCWFALIAFHCFSLLVIDFKCCALIVVDVYWLSAIVIDVWWFTLPLVYLHMHLIVTTGVHWFPCVFIDIDCLTFARVRCLSLSSIELIWFSYILTLFQWYSLIVDGFHWPSLTRGVHGRHMGGIDFIGVHLGFVGFPWCSLMDIGFHLASYMFLWF